MKHLFFYFLSFFLFVNCSTTKRTELVPFDNEKGLWGYMDYTSHKEIIPPEYDLAYPFINNYAIVGYNENNHFRFGVIDTLGNYVLNPEYQTVYIKNGYIHAKKGNIARLFNFELKEEIPLIYEDVHAFDHRYFCVKKNGKWGCYDIQEQREVSTFEYDEFNVYKCVPSSFNASKYSNQDIVTDIDYRDKRVSVIDKAGKILFSERYGWAGRPFYKEGLMAFIKRDGNGKWGFIDTHGKIVIPYMYDSVDTFGFYGGFAIVSEIGENPTRNKNAVINKKNEIIFPFALDSTYTILEDSTICIFNEQTRKSKLVDNKLNEIIPYKYEEIECIGEGYYKGKVDSIYAVIDKSGKECLSARFANILKFKNGMCAVICTTGRGGCINTKAEYIIPCKYKLEYDSDYWFGSGFLYTKNDSLASRDKIMLLDKNGREYIVKRLPMKIIM